MVPLELELEPVTVAYLHHLTRSLRNEMGSTSTVGLSRAWKGAVTERYLGEFQAAAKVYTYKRMYVDLTVL